VFGGGWPGKRKQGPESAQQSEQSAQSEPPPPAGPQESQPGGPAAKSARIRLLVLGGVTIMVLAAGATYALVHSGTGQPAGGGQKAAVATGPLKVESVIPGPGTAQVDGTAPIAVSFSEALAANSPKPVLDPSVPGSWTQDGNVLIFTPAAAFRPDSRETVEVPAGLTGVRSQSGTELNSPVIEHFATGGYSPLRLAELLSQLGYLPLDWAADMPAGMGHSSGATWDQATGQVQMAYDPPAGTFSWLPGYPSVLTSMWNPNQANPLLTGAVMAFESQHGMTINGAVDAQLWDKLFRAAASGDRNKNGYTYAIASKAAPETLTIWHDGRVVMRSLANTGIPVSPTVDGTFPVYLRFRFQIMQGTNPDGSSYADPVSFVSYFNGGDAVHYFPRGSYGFQQSLGCVELPYTSAEEAWPYLTYGSLVTVAG
jgi:hypothetical protein